MRKLIFRVPFTSIFEVIGNKIYPPGIFCYKHLPTVGEVIKVESESGKLFPGKVTDVHPETGTYDAEVDLSTEVSK